MTTLRALRWLAFVPGMVLAPSLAAQAVSGSFSPNPALLGEPITFTGTDATGEGFVLSTPCAWLRIRAGAPDGPVLPQGLVCPQIIVPIGPDGSYSITWDQTVYVAPDRVLVPPGTYWFEIESHAPVTYQRRTDLFCIFIQDAGAPSLKQTGPVRVGGTTGLELSAPAQPFGLYALAASWTSNRPLHGLGVPLCLSPDSLLDLSLARPSGLFARGAGFLDAAGNARGVEVRIPDVPALAHRGFHVQALLGTSTGLEVTNDLSLTIQP